MEMDVCCAVNVQDYVDLCGYECCAEMNEDNEIVYECDPVPGTHYEIRVCAMNDVWVYKNGDVLGKVLHFYGNENAVRDAVENAVKVVNEDFKTKSKKLKQVTFDCTVFLSGEFDPDVETADEAIDRIIENADITSHDLSFNFGSENVFDDTSEE